MPETGEHAEVAKSPLELGIGLVASSERELAKRFEERPSVAMMTLGSLLISGVVLVQILLEIDVFTPARLSHLTSFEFCIALAAGVLLVLGGAAMRAYSYRREIEFDMMRFEKGALLLETVADAGKTLTAKQEVSRGGL